MNTTLGAAFFFVLIPFAIALAGFTLLRRRGTRSGVAGCGALVIGLFVSAVVLGVSVYSTIS